MFNRTSLSCRNIALGSSLLAFCFGCGGGTPATVAPSAAPQVIAENTAVTNIEQQSGWQSCDTCAGVEGFGPAGDHGMVQGITSPSLNGMSTQFWLGGTTPYSNALWWKTIVGADQTEINEKTHHFVLELDFFLDNPNAAESLEWDVNQFVDGHSLIFGSQCSYRSRATWDVWDNVNNHWVSTGIACPAPQVNVWNHVRLEFERTADNQVHYIAMTMNGKRHLLDWFYDSTPTPWNGFDVNVQLDGDFQQERYSEWIENMTLTYW